MAKVKACDADTAYMWNDLFRSVAGAMVCATLAMAPAAGQSKPVPLDRHLIRAWSGPDAPEGTIEDLARTPDGYVWLATGDGLLRFDGSRFTRYDTSSDTILLSDDVFALAATPGGDLWIGTAAGLLRRQADGLLVRVDVPGLMRPQIQTLLWEGNGLWAGTADAGLIRLQGNEVMRYTDEHGVPQGMLRALAPARGGGVWVGSAGGGVARVRTGGTDRHALSGEDVHDILDEPDGLWVATRAGVGRIAAGGSVWVKQRGLADAYVTRLLRDSRGDLWMATSGKGLFRRQRDGALEHLPIAAESSPLDVRALAIDDRGTLLVGTVGAGLLSVFAGDVLPLTTAHGLPHPVALAVLADPDGGLWAGTFGGGVARVHADGTVTAVFDTADGLPDQTVLALAQHRDTIWVGTRRGLASLGAGSVQVASESALSGVGVTALYVDREERLWIGTVQGVYVRDRQGLRSITARDGLSAEFVFAITQSRTGAMLIGTQGGGISRLRPDGGVDTIGATDGLPSEVVFHLYEDSSHTLWAGTPAGLTRIKDGSVATLTVRHGLPDETVYAITDDGFGRAVITSDRGIALVAWDALNAVADGHANTLDPLVLTDAHGMPSTETNGGVQPSITRTTDGLLWVPTMKGLAALKPGGLSASVPGRVQVEAVKLDTSHATMDTPVALPPNPHRITITYTAVDFRAPEALRFRYKLAGYDDEWTSAAAERNAHYTGLPPGHYTFQVQARSGNGEWGEAGVLPIEVRPALYETPLFRAALVLLLGASSLLLHKSRVRGLKQRERTLWALIEARDRAEQERIEAEEQLEAAQKMEAMGRLAAGVAHDFNNLLTAIFGHADLLRERCAADTAALGEIDELRATVDRATALTRQLLSFSRKQEWSPGLVDLDEVVRGMESMLRRTLGERVALRTMLAGSGAVVKADRGQLEQVLLNLAINARDAMPEGGTITIGTSRCHRDAAPGSDGETAEVYVADTGAGMDESTRLHLFEPFYTTKTEGKGTGLGLSIVATIVERHGGTIAVETGLGSGSTFRVRLPVASTAVVSEGESQLEDDARQDQTARILLVEDEAAVRSLARRLLETKGYQVVAASSAEEALHRWDQDPATFDLLITDLGLPSLGGKALADRLRADRGDLPILFMSGYDETEADIGALSNPVAFLSKPFDLERLTAQVRSVLERRGLSHVSSSKAPDIVSSPVPERGPTEPRDRSHLITGPSRPSPQEQTSREPAGDY